MSKRNKQISDHYALNYERLVKRCVNRVPDRSQALAEEVVQEAYTRALKYFRTYDWKINDFDVWFNSILKNAINDCRQIERERGVSQELHENMEELVPHKMTKDAQVEVTKRILTSSAKPVERSVLTLFHIIGYKSMEISQYLSINHNTVRQIIMRFRMKMDDTNQTDA